jgi:hypothetical protein
MTYKQPIKKKIANLEAKVLRNEYRMLDIQAEMDYGCKYSSLTAKEQFQIAKKVQKRLS